MRSAIGRATWRMFRKQLSVPCVHRFFQARHFREVPVRMQLRFVGDLRRPNDPYWFRREPHPAQPSELEAEWRARVAANIRRRRTARRIARATCRRAVAA